MNKTIFPRGIEIVTGAIIENQEGEIFLMQSPKWGDTWIIPGGHVETGERIIASAMREVKEETGLETKPIKILQYQELINPTDFHRAAHLLSFICVLKANNKQVKIDTKEVSGYKWVPLEEISNQNLAKGLQNVFQNYLSEKEK